MKKEKGVSHIHAKRVEAYVQDGVKKIMDYIEVYNVQRKSWAWKRLYDLQKRKRCVLHSLESKNIQALVVSLRQEMLMWFNPFKP